MTSTLLPMGWKVGRLENVWGDMDRMMGAFLGGESGKSVDWAPRLDLSETDSHYELHLDLPGVSEDDLEIEFHEGNLSVAGHRGESPDEPDRSWHRVERRRGTFRRVIRLGEEIEAEGIEAEHTDGVLVIRVPKAETVKPRRISLKS
jgi:HSP20 family protein